MRGFGSAVWPRVAIVGALGLALAGCADVDEALFGPYPANQTAQAPASSQGENADNAQQQATAPEASAAPSEQASTNTSAQPSATEAEAAPPPPAAQPETRTAMASEAEAPTVPAPENGAPLPGTLPPVGGSAFATTSMGPAIAAGSAVQAVRIEPGRNTGTPVGKMVGGLRAQLVGLENKLMENARRLGVLRQNNARATERYQNARAQIMTRLQVGTTRGNPELVNQWNTAQSALDQLTTNLNSMGNLGTDATSDANSVRQAVQQITAAYDLPGAVDEDHRQLNVLEDEAKQMLISYDRLRKEVAADAPRQATFLASERASLAKLEGAIKRGDIYGSAGTSVDYASLPEASASADPTRPLVVIKFDRPNVSYQQILLSALQDALKSRPSATFKVVAVTPPRGSASDVARAQGLSKRHVEDVLRSMADMGVPASRVQVASSTDPDVQASEVRVFVI